MNASADSGSIFDVLGIVVFVGLPILAVALENGQKLVTRARFALWTGAFLFLLLNIFIYYGIAYIDFELPPLISVLPPLLALYLLIFFYVQRIARRSFDAGLRKIVAYCAAIPVVNLLFIILLLLMPSKRRAGDAQQLYSCFCKAAECEPGEPKISKNWFFARRASFRVFDDRVQCGNWTFPFPAINRATVYKTKQWPFTHDVLQLEMGGRCVQFGFFIWANPIKHLKLDIETRNATLKTHPATILFRIALVGILAYEIWKRTPGS